MSKSTTSVHAGKAIEASSDAWTGTAPLSDRINSEPAILRGLSSSEIITAAAVFFPVWLVIGLLLGGLLHIMQLAFILPIGGPMASVWISAGFLARVKRNRPNHYHWLALQWWLHKSLGFPAPFIAHGGSWDLGRSMPPEPAPSRRRRARSPSSPGALPEAPHQEPAP